MVINIKFLKTKKAKALIVVLVLLVALVIRHFYNASNNFYTPDYEKKDISQIIRYEHISDKDYMLIYEQTGVAPAVAKELIADKEYEALRELNERYFNKPQIKKNYIAFPVTAEERNETQKTPLVNLKKGDVLVSFNTHTLDWRHGHCGLVLDEDGSTLLEHMSIGNTSCVTSAKNWGKYPGFVVLRYPDEEIAAQAADYAKEHLVDIDYSIFAGIIKKDKSDEERPESSHCSHIVWQAYKAFGVDIDRDGGPIVTPYDVALSDKLSVVQIYGVNPDKYTPRILK